MNNQQWTESTGMLEPPILMAHQFRLNGGQTLPKIFGHCSEGAVSPDGLRPHEGQRPEGGQTIMQNFPVQLIWRCWLGDVGR